MDFLDSVRPWYSKFAVFDFSIAILVLGITTLIGLFLFVVFQGCLKSISSAAMGGTAGELVIYMSGGISVMVTASLLNHFKRKIFPMGVFAFRDGLKRYDSLEVIRTCVVLAFIVSIAASIFFSFLSR